MLAALMLAALLPAAAPALAQPVEQPPLPGAPRPLTMVPPVEHMLPNGLRVVVAPRAGVALVSAVLLVRSGAEVDPPHQAGLASLTAGLLTQGTRRHSAPRLAAAAEALGGTLNSSAGWNRSEVSITVGTPQLDAALGLIAEVALEPVFAAGEFERLRAQTLDQLKVEYASAGALARQAAERLVFGAGAYGHPASGTPQSLARIARSELVALHRRHYRPDNAVLVLAGDITPAAGESLARRHFGAWRGAGSAPPATRPDPGRALDIPAAVIDVPGSGQAAVVMALALPHRDEDERAVASVLNAVLGGGYSARLNQEIRIRRGLSYGAGSQFETRRDADVLRIAVQTRNDAAADVAALVVEQVDRLMRVPVEADELAARKAALIGGFGRSVETSAGLAATLVGLLVADRPVAALMDRIDALAGVGADQVGRYAASNLGPAARRIVVAGETARFGPAIAAAWPGALAIDAARLDLERGDGLSNR